MGSRITRAIYKQQRRLPIKKQRQQDIKTLIICFLGSVNTITFFLFGYLFRPHIRSPQTIPLYLLIILVFLYLSLKQVERASFLSSLALFIIIIICKIFSIQLTLLKAVLILLTTTLSAVTNFEISHQSFLQTFFLWLAYTCFGLGIKLSLIVAKINIQQNPAGVQRQESLLAQVVFSLVGIMSICLIFVGKKTLKNKNTILQQQPTFGKQLFYASLTFILTLFAFAAKSSMEHQFIHQIITIGICMVIVILFQKKQILHYLWIIVGILGIITYLIDFLTQGEKSIQIWINLSKMLMIDLFLIDSVERWIKWSRSGTNRPILIVFLYFSSFYLSQFSLVGVQIFSYLDGIFKELIALGLYIGILMLHRFDKASIENYQEVIV